MLDPLAQKELVHMGSKMSASVGVDCDRSAKVGEKLGETIDNCHFVVFEGCPSVGEAGKIIDEMENVPHELQSHLQVSDLDLLVEGTIIVRETKGIRGIRLN